MHHLVNRLRERGIELVISGVKAQVLDVMKRTGLHEELGEQHVFRSTEAAVKAVEGWLGEPLSAAQTPVKAQLANGQG